MHPIYWVFLVCGLLGSTIVVFQFVLSLVGMGGEHGLDAGHSLEVSLAHDMPHDAGHDLPHEAGHNLPGHGDSPGHDSTWTFGVVSLRAIVAGVAFFGLSGLAAMSAELPVLTAMAIAVVGGGGAFGVAHLVMSGLSRLRADGTLRIERAIGKTGTVHLSIPGERKGAGKIQVSVQGRLEEFRAVTAGAQQLPSGAKVVVIGVESPRTLEVALQSDAPA